MNVPSPVPELIIRPMESADAAGVTVLASQLGYERSEQEVYQWIQTLPQRSKSQAAFVACLGRKIVGWIEISIEHRLQSPPYALIGGLVVKDGYRNQQIGLRLCQHAENWSWQNGVPTVRVTSRSTRLDAHRFYLRNGYRPAKISHVFEKTRPS